VYSKMENEKNPAAGTPHLSVVIPVYGCEKCLLPLYDRLLSVLNPISESFEIIFVNDASPDDAWGIITTLCKKDRRVRGVNFSRNFGQQRAIYAGLDLAEGEWIVVMDCDLQDRPEEIRQLYSTARSGYDIVWGLRSGRQDALFKKLGSKIFTKVFNYLADTDIGEDVTNFTIISSTVVKKLRLLREQNTFYIVNLRWLGFVSGQVYVEHAQRMHGKSAYTLPKLLDLAFNIMLAYSNRPLKLMIALGLFIALLSFGYAFWLVVRYHFYEIPVVGWTSVMVTLNFIGGVLLANMGVLGLYISKSFDEQKMRPLYIIRETINFNKPD